MTKYKDASEFEEIAGERIQEWIESNLVNNPEFTRNPTEDDEYLFDQDIAWVFTVRGQRLYDSYLNKVYNLAHKLFPDDVYFEIEKYTGIIEP